MSKTQLTKRLEAIERHRDVEHIEINVQIMESAEHVKHPERYELVSREPMADRTTETASVYICHYKRRHDAPPPEPEFIDSLNHRGIVWE